MNAKQKILFAFTFLILLVGRICISGNGYLEDTDEWFYIFLHKHSAQLLSPATLVKCVFDTQSLFPETVIRMFEYGSVKPLANFLGKDMLHPDILHLVSFYNIVTSLVILYIFFKILCRLGFSVELALTGVLLLGTLFNYNLYTRHFLPYDHALLFHLCATYILLNKKPSAKTYISAGLFSTLGLTSYFGSFMFLFINGCLVLLPYRLQIKHAIKPAIFFILPHIVLFGLYETLSYAYENRSYIEYIIDYSETVAMASADEGYSYVFIYMYLVEKWWGIALLLLFFLGTIISFFTPNHIEIKRFIGVGIAAYLIYGTYVYFFQQMVFYGRVIHPYILFVVVGVLALLQIPQNTFKKYLPVPLVILAIVNYGFVIQDFNSIGYPRNSMYQTNLFYGNDNVNITYVNEITEGIHYDSYREDLSIPKFTKTSLPEGNYEAVNIGFMMHYPDSFMTKYNAYISSNEDNVIFQKLHFQSHPAYALEYCTRNGRTFFIDKKFKIRIVKKAIHSASE